MKKLVFAGVAALLGLAGGLVRGETEEGAGEDVESPAVEVVVVNGGTASGPSTSTELPGEVQTAARVMDLAGAFVNEGFRRRDTIWTMTLRPEEVTTIAVWLFARNEYWFSAATLPDQSISLRLFCGEGSAVKKEQWKENGMAALGVVPTQTGWFYLQVQQTGPEAAPFSLVYSYR
jgi:hypothetical protein